MIINYILIPFFLWSSSWRKTWTSWNHHYWHYCWLGVNGFLLFWSYVQHSGSQSVQAPSQSLGQAWISKVFSPNGEAGCGFQPSKNLIRDIHAADRCGMLHLSGIVCQTAISGDLQHPDQSDIQGCHGASTCWMLELCIPKPVKAIRKHEYHGKHGKTMGNR